MKLVLVDNYDSFTYNILHLFAAQPDVEVMVMRNDDKKINTLLELADVDGIIIGPGPGDPTNDKYFGSNNALIKNATVPILGICLGFQGIATLYGAKLVQSMHPKHGKTSKIVHSENKLFTGCPKTFSVMRYHSLIIDMNEGLPSDIQILSEVSHDDQSYVQNAREVMAIKIKDTQLYGIQFHPESFASEYGAQIAKNFIAIAKECKR